MVERGEKNEEEFKTVCVILASLLFLLGLSLQEASLQEIYQVRESSKEARWAQRMKNSCRVTDPPEGCEGQKGKRQGQGI